MLACLSPLSFSPPVASAPPSLFSKPTWNATTHDPNSISSYYCTDSAALLVVAAKDTSHFPDVNFVSPQRIPALARARARRPQAP